MIMGKTSRKESGKDGSLRLPTAGEIITGLRIMQWGNYSAYFMYGESLVSNGCCMVLTLVTVTK